MEDRLELSGGVIAALVAGAVVLAVIVLIATRGGSGGSKAGTTGEDRARFDAFAEQLILDLTFSQTRPRPPPATVLGELFGKQIADYTIRVGKLDRSTPPGVARDQVRPLRRAILSDSLKRVLDRDTVQALGDVLDRALAARLSGGARADDDALDRAVIAFNNRMVAGGQPYVLHAHVNRRGAVWLLSYAVDQQVHYRAGDQRVTAIRVRRLDTLNFHANALGFASPRRALAWVRPGRIEEALVSRILPQLGDDPPPYYHVRDYQKREPWVPLANRRARVLIAHDYGDLAPDPAAARRLGALLARRWQLFSRWIDLRRHFARTRRRMSRRLHLSTRYRSVLEGLPQDDLVELMTIENELASPAMVEAFAAAMEVAMRSVEGHEVQHRLDFARSDRPYPSFLSLTADAGADETTRPSRFAESTNLELSAMLSELARDPVRARSDLASQVSFLLQPNVANSQYGKAVAVIVDGLALQLGVLGGPVHEHSALRRDRVVTLFANLTAMPATKLADGARALWQKLYQAPLPVLSRAVQ